MSGRPNGRTTGAEVRIVLWCQPNGLWRWAYFEPDLELLSNEGYEARVEAEEAARLAYPGIRVVEKEDEGPSSAARRSPLRSLGLIFLALLLIAAATALGALALLAVGARRLGRRVRIAVRRAR